MDSCLWAILDATKPRGGKPVEKIMKKPHTVNMLASGEARPVYTPQ